MEVAMHDGSRIRLKKLDPGYDPTSKLNAFKTLETTAAPTRSSSRG